MEVFAEYVKRYFFIVKLVFVAALAAELAVLVTNRIDSKIGGTPRLEVDNVKVKEGRGFVAIGEYEPILKKNVFNPNFVYVEGMLSGRTNKASVPDDYDLLGTVAWADPYAMAIIRARVANAVDVYRVGEMIQDEAEVVKIERKKVEIKRNNKIEVLELPEIEAPTAGISAFGDVTVGEDGIAKAGEDAFVVDKQVVDGAFENWGQMMRGARVVPHFEKGRIDGFKISRIKGDSLYKKIGLEDGDIIHRINGIEIKGPDDALRLMSELRDAKNVAIDVSRKGQRRSFSYSVR